MIQQGLDSPRAGLEAGKSKDRRTKEILKWNISDFLLLLKVKPHDNHISNECFELETLLLIPLHILTLHLTWVKEWRRLGVHVGGMKTCTTAMVKIEGAWEFLFLQMLAFHVCAWGWRFPPAISRLDSVYYSQHNTMPCWCAKFMNVIEIYEHNYFQQLKITI